MPKIYVVSGEHWEVPGRRMTAHSTEHGANAAALAMTLRLMKDSGIRPGRKFTWQEGVEALQTKHGAQYVYVEIDELILDPGDV